MKPLIIKEWGTKFGHKARLVLHMGHINGYVEPNKSKLKSVYLDYFLFEDEIENLPENLRDIQEKINNIEVHGGITYYGEDIFGECVFGFDTAHIGDKQDFDFHLSYIGRMTEEEIQQIERLKELDYTINEEGTFKDIEYCTNECEKLSEQIKEIEDTIETIS